MVNKHFLFKDKSLIRLILWGVIASAFFSSTFVLNRAMSLGGGHWIWTASLRYLYMLVILFLWLIITKGFTSIKEVLLVFQNYWKFWIFTGTIGFGFFYAPLVFASQYAPGWIVASTWQFTIIATALILILFGEKLPLKALGFSILIFFGIILVNLEQATQFNITTILLGVIPIIIAAFAYPFGNQLVGEAKQGTHRLIPHITAKIMDSAPARVLLMTLGSMPFWIICICLANF